MCLSPNELDKKYDMTTTSELFGIYLLVVSLSPNELDKKHDLTTTSEIFGYFSL